MYGMPLCSCCSFFLLTAWMISFFFSRTGSSWPHGRTSVIAMLLSILSYAFTTLASNGCFYVQIDGALFDFPPYGIRGSSLKYGVGLYSYEDRFEDDWSCSYYTNNMIDDAIYFDSAFRTARAFAVMANAFTGIAMICLMVSACVGFAPAAMKGVGAFLIFGSLCELLTFVFFASKVCDTFTCDFYAGAGFAVMSFTFSFLTGLLTLKIPPAKEEFEGESMPPAPTEAVPVPGTETVTETTMPDGTIKTTKTTVNPDGSQTVEETVTQPDQPEKV
jgi:hypothetical protein